MADRLSPLDVSFFYLETPTTAMHVGSVALLEPPPGGPDLARLERHVCARVLAVPRYRQKVRFIPGRLANPVWVDDPDFDPTYHVRRSALPRPGTRAQLRELVARIQARQLDRSRPLWEIYLVEGLDDGCVAILTKTHHAMVDGVRAVDIGQLILEPTPDAAYVPPPPWRPAREPTDVDLVADAIADIVASPGAGLEAVRASLADAGAVATRAAGAVAGLVAAASTAARPAPAGPLNADIGAARRYGTADTRLEDYKRVRRAHGGTVNDVVLATVAGAVRRWLLTRGEQVSAATSVRAMVPVSVRGPGQAPGLGNHISAYFVDLPVGEPDPLLRLLRIGTAMREHKAEGQSVGAEALVALSGFAPPTLHALGARLASTISRHLFNVLVTNVPGPQVPLYAAGARMVAAYPVAPLAKGQVVSIGLTSYDGGVYYGLNCDRDAMPDVDVLAGLLEESLDELTGTVR